MSSATPNATSNAGRTATCASAGPPPACSSPSSSSDGSSATATLPSSSSPSSATPSSPAPPNPTTTRSPSPLPSDLQSGATAVEVPRRSGQPPARPMTDRLDVPAALSSAANPQAQSLGGGPIVANSG